MTKPLPSCLSIERALDFVGDMQGVIQLLGTLASSLQQDMAQLQACLDAGDLPGAQRLLHQIKGFAPVFCVDSLVTQVVMVERLSKAEDLQAVREAHAGLRPQLQQLLAEVQERLAQG